MRITERKLRKIIREEAKNLMTESQVSESDLKRMGFKPFGSNERMVFQGTNEGYVLNINNDITLIYGLDSEEGNEPFFLIEFSRTGNGARWFDPDMRTIKRAVSKVRNLVSSQGQIDAMELDRKFGRLMDKADQQW